MELSAEKKKSYHSIQTVAVQIYDCIRNNDERLWDMLEVKMRFKPYAVEDKEGYFPRKEMG